MELGTYVRVSPPEVSTVIGVLYICREYERV